MTVMDTGNTLTIDTRVEELYSPAFWQAHFPKLTINSHLKAWDRDTGVLPSDTRRLHTERMLEEGYFQDRNETFAKYAPLLAEAVFTCKTLDIPPTFIFLFDETWKCFYSLHPMLTHCCCHVRMIGRHTNLFGPALQSTFGHTHHHRFASQIQQRLARQTGRSKARRHHGLETQHDQLSSGRASSTSMIGMSSRIG